MPQKALLGSEE